MVILGILSQAPHRYDRRTSLLCNPAFASRLAGSVTFQERLALFSRLAGAPITRLRSAMLGLSLAGYFGGQEEETPWQSGP